MATAEGRQVRPSGDVWAVGVIACLALTGRMPLPGQTPWARAEAAAEYAAGQRDLVLPEGLPEPWRGVIAACLHRDPERRPTAPELARRLGSAATPPGRPRPRLPGGARRRLPETGRLRAWTVAGAAAVLGALAWQLLPTLSGGSTDGSTAASTGGSTAATRQATASPPLSPSGSSSVKPAVPPGACTARGQEQRDTYTGVLWQAVWYCANDTGAPQYAAPDGREVIGWIQTTTSWFLCYRRGAPGPDRSTVWYYTQGDQVAAGKQNRHSWGYTASVFVRASTHPYPGVPACPAGT